MKILLISQYFKPEVGAGIARITHLTKHLVETGHKLKVITGIPNYPTGKIYSGYKLKFLQREVVGKNLEVIRTFVYPTKYASTFRRILNYLSFTASSFLVGLFNKNTDVLISSSPPLTVGAVGLLLSIIKKKPLIFEARDVWPGAAVELGVLRNSLIIKILKFVEAAIYKRAKFIVIPTEETKKILLDDNKFLIKEKVKVVLNSVDMELFDRQKIDDSLTKKFDLEGKFVVLYSGTIGLQQGMDTFFGCVKQLKNTWSIKFLVTGEGVDKDRLKQSIKTFRLDNIILLDAIEYKYIPSFVNVCDIGLALLKRNKYQDAALAVKVFDYFAGRKPVIVSGGEAMRKIVEGNNIGYWVEPEDPKKLSNKIIEISKMPKEILKKSGDRARVLVEKKFNREMQVKEWDKILEVVNEDLH